jgi:hypothetical protein
MVGETIDMSRLPRPTSSMCTVAAPPPATSISMSPSASVTRLAKVAMVIAWPRLGSIVAILSVSA